MLYFKHSELVNNYHVSLKTVHNWIDAAKQGKLEVQLHERNGRTYIANTPTNLIALENLADKGKKYRNTLHHKVVTPRAEFYELYSPRQILDIISNLNIHREIPRQYNYLDGGANNWDNWLKRIANEQTSNLLKGTVELLHNNLGVILRLLEGKRRVNVIDIGVGNAFPIQELLGNLLDRGLLHRYIGIDISQSMLDIAEKNITEWFGGRVNFEGHLRDMGFERFDDLLISDMLGSRSEETINLVLLLGATPANFRNPTDILKVTYGSLGNNDLFVYTDKRDTEAARRYFDFGSQAGAAQLSPNHSFILSLMNIDPSIYEPEMGYDSAKRMRYIRIRLNTALTIQFKFRGVERSVNLEKGDTILLFRYWHQTVLELISDFEEVGFTLLHSSLTNNREYLLTISGVDRGISRG